MSAVQQVLFTTGSSVSISLPPEIIAYATAESFFNAQASANVSLLLQSAGDVNLAADAAGSVTDVSSPINYTWIDGGVASLYAVRMRTISGDSLAGSPTGSTWLPINDQNFVWYLNAESSLGNTPVVKGTQSVLEIAFKDNTTSILANSIINFTVSATTSDSPLSE